MTIPVSLYLKNLEQPNWIKDAKSNKQKTKEKTPRKSLILNNLIILE